MTIRVITPEQSLTFSDLKSLPEKYKQAGNFIEIPLEESPFASKQNILGITYEGELVPILTTQAKDLSFEQVLTLAIKGEN
jgi:hypothetical protein